MNRLLGNMRQNIELKLKCWPDTMYHVIDISCAYSLGGFSYVGVPAWDFPDCHTPGPSWLRHGGSVCQI